MYNVKYDPSKRYSWLPADKFELTGDQFGTVLNAIRAIMGTPEAQHIIALSKANDVFEVLMTNAVEDGTVLEIPTQESNNKLQAKLKVVK
jgi:hypothetical protein